MSERLIRGAVTLWILALVACQSTVCAMPASRIPSQSLKAVQREFVPSVPNGTTIVDQRAGESQQDYVKRGPLPTDEQAEKGTIEVSTVAERRAHARNIVGGVLGLLALILGVATYLRRRRIGTGVVACLAVSAACLCPQTLAAPSLHPSGAKGRQAVYNDVQRAQGRVRLAKLTYRLTERTFPSPELRDPATLAADLQRLYQTIPENLTAAQRQQEQKDTRENFMSHERGGTESDVISYSFQRRAPSSEPASVRIETQGATSTLPKADDRNLKHHVELFDGKNTYDMFPDAKLTSVKRGNQLDRRSLPEEVLLMGTPLSQLMPSSTTKVSIPSGALVLLSGPCPPLGVPELHVYADRRRGYEIVCIKEPYNSVVVLSSVKQSGVWEPARIVYSAWTSSKKYGRWLASRSQFDLIAATAQTF